MQTNLIYTYNNLFKKLSLMLYLLSRPYASFAEKSWENYVVQRQRFFCFLKIYLAIFPEILKI